MNLVELLLDGAGADEDAAVLSLERTHTYGDLRAASRRVAAWLRGAGLTTGDRVLLVGENSFFWIASYLAILGQGGVAVPLPASASPEHAHAVRDQTEAKIAVVEGVRAARAASLVAKNARVLFAAKPMHEGVEGAVFADLRAEEPARVDVKSEALAALMPTSGSTATPRLVMVSHGNIAANTRAIVRYLSLGAADRAMVVLPFHYCFGASLLHTHLAVGAALVLDHRFMFADKVLARMRDTDCTVFAGVPSHFQILLRRSSLKEMRFPKLRIVQQAGGKLADALLTELAETVAPARVFVMYGQTEATARLSYLPPEQLSSKRGSIGRGIEGVRLRVVDERGLDVRPGALGEVVAEGDSIALGYWRDEAASASVFRDGRLHTGDLATVDADGDISIVDRARDFLKCGGVRVASRTVEEVLLAHPEVIEAAVLPIPDELLGEAVAAYVVTSARSDEGFATRLVAFCQERLTPELVPKRVQLLDALPKNDAGKVIKRALRTEPS